MGEEALSLVAEGRIRAEVCGTTVFWQQWGKSMNGKEHHNFGFPRRGVSGFFYPYGIHGSLTRHWIQVRSVQARFSRVIQSPGKLSYSGVITAQPNLLNHERRKIQLTGNVGG